MNPQEAAKLFEILSSPVRLQIYRLLVAQVETGMVASELAAALQIAPSNLSFHLKNMTHAQFITLSSEGRFQRYRANLALMQQLIHFLTDQCCAGNPAQCFNLSAEGLCK